VTERGVIHGAGHDVLSTGPRDARVRAPEGPHRDAHGSVHDRIDVQRVLEESLLQHAEVVSGGARLGRDVTWCLPFDEVARLGVGGANDAEPLDGVAVVATAAQLCAAGAAGIRTLANRGASVVFVQGRAGHEPALDEDCGLAVVRLPAGVAFPSVNRVVAELTLAKETHVLRYGLVVHQTLAELLYRGSGLAALARQLSRLTGCAVAILDPHGRRLTYEDERQNPSLPPPDALLARVVAVGGLTPVELAADVPPQATGQLDVTVDDEQVSCLVRSIVLGGRHDGWIVLVEAGGAASWHERARHEVVLEQATMIVGSEMLRLRSVDAAEERARGDFVHALLHGRLSNPQELSARAAYYDFDVAGRYGVVVARQVGVAGSTESQQKMQQLTRAASGLLARQGMPSLVTIVGDVLAIVLQTEADSLQRGSRQVEAFARDLHRELTRLDARPLTVTYGRPANGATKIVDSYREARVALGVCERLLITDVSGYGELRVFGALLELASSQRGQMFAREVLEPLRKAGKKSGGDLEDAVVTYIECSGNLNAAARRMSLHRNTMLYKLDRAARVLGMDLRQAEDQFTFWLAYRIELLGDVQTQVGRELAPRS
jgi:sugar diacid utilization regulator